MHNAALEHCGLPVRYTRLHIGAPDLAEAVRLLPKAGFLGTNVTIPHKHAMPGLMDEVDQRAGQIGVVNTVVVDGDKLRGFNTDGPGLVRALRADFGVDLRDLRVLLLGAGGGAGRAIAWQCAIENCERLVLVNRTVEKAAALAQEIKSTFAAARVGGPGDRLIVAPFENAALRAQLENIDLIINATDVGLKAGDPSPLAASLISAHHMVYDTIYVAGRTPLLRAAEQSGARVANGLSMLLHQGALSFEIWFNREAPLAVMESALRKAVGQL